MVWKVKEIAEARGITNARALSAKAGIPPMSMYAIWNGTATRVDLATLEKLCKELRVPLALLLEYIPEVIEPLPSSTQKTELKGAGQRPKPSKTNA